MHIWLFLPLSSRRGRRLDAPYSSHPKTNRGRRGAVPYIHFLNAANFSVPVGTVVLDSPLCCRQTMFAPTLIGSNPHLPKETTPVGVVSFWRRRWDCVLANFISLFPRKREKSAHSVARPCFAQCLFYFNSLRRIDSCSNDLGRKEFPMWVRIPYIKKEELPFGQLFFFGADGGIRTHVPFYRQTDFESAPL